MPLVEDLKSQMTSEKVAGGMLGGQQAFGCTALAPLCGPLGLA